MIAPQKYNNIIAFNCKMLQTALKERYPTATIIHDKREALLRMRIKTATIDFFDLKKWLRTQPCCIIHRVHEGAEARFPDYGQLETPEISIPLVFACTLLTWTIKFVTKNNFT